ncbi:KamA family radical SAM protein [Geothermobacter hydrogeniphilus]|uniref:Lysine 2,3-aminomutase n=1 Tax=Geothermobacter hydrogeniphilus TaxID=1969733 RepID=A0A1X0Y473_9BACT|nr:KamA family radical SAM protein [Geothermobacter hydrogeniphilus]ORJ59854.1 lysine 2,3-aminomutase [Geothermobacter hydrogeniphilus]
MESWQQSLRAAITSPQQLADRFAIDPRPLEAVCVRYPLRITPYYAGLIREVGDPIWRQCVPDPAERDDAGLPTDPLAEEAHSPVPALVHRYPDRGLLLAGNSCAGYCRFCTRKRRIGRPEFNISFTELQQGIATIAATPQIRDVLISGGDPLLLNDAMLQELLGRLRAIPHVEIIRIGSRIPVVLPERVTPSLCRILRQHPPLYLNTHFNHPRELTEQSWQACARLAEAGVVLGNQTVLLRGVNDDLETLLELNRNLLQMRVRPYYLHQMDLTAGTGHFRVRVEKGRELVAGLRGRITGMGIPQYVIDLPGGKGKVPVNGDYVETWGDELVLRAPDGTKVVYRQT